MQVQQNQSRNYDRCLFAPSPGFIRTSDAWGATRDKFHGQFCDFNDLKRQHEEAKALCNSDEEFNREWLELYDKMIAQEKAENHIAGYAILLDRYKMEKISLRALAIVYSNEKSRRRKGKKGDSDNYAPTLKTSTVADIRAWVETHRGSPTIMEIRDGLSEKMENNNIYTFNHPNKSKGKAFMIQGVSDQFYKNLKAFIREPDVQVKHSILDAMIVDPVVYRSRPGMHYMPVTVRINKRAPKIAKRPRKC